MQPIDPPQDPEAWAIGFGLTVVLVLAALVAALFWLWSLYRAIRDPTLSDAQRITWVLVVLLLPVIGAILYFTFKPRGTIAGPMQGT